MSDRRRLIVDPVERFWAYVDKGEDCWLWNGSLAPQGYGELRVYGVRTGAHRFSYELHTGSIPPGYDVDHLCKVTNCVNPAHLEAVTHRENMRRGDAPNWASNRTGLCKRGHSLADAPRRRDGRIIHCRVCADAKVGLTAPTAATPSALELDVAWVTVDAS